MTSFCGPLLPPACNPMQSEFCLVFSTGISRNTGTGKTCGRSSGCAPPVAPTGLPAGSVSPLPLPTSWSCCSSPAPSFDRHAPEIKFVQLWPAEICFTVLLRVQNLEQSWLRDGVAAPARVPLLDYSWLSIGVISVPTPLIDTDDDNYAAAGPPAWVRSIYVNSVEVFALPEMVYLGL